MSRSLGAPTSRRPSSAEDLEDLVRPSGGASFRDWGLLALRAAWHRKGIASLALATGLLATAAYYHLKTPLYRVEARIHAQRQQALPGVVRPGAPDDLPTRSAWEVIHRRDRLLAMARDLDLSASAPSESVDRVRQWLRALKARLTGAEFLPDTTAPDGELLESVARRLDRALEVSAAEGTITVAVEWEDPRQAHRIVETAVQDFLEARHLQEVSAIDEVISTLHARAASLREDLDRTLEEDRRHAAGERSRAVRTATGNGTDRSSQELARVKSLLDARERSIADVEDFRRRRLTELQAQLDAQRTVYSEAHPVVINLRRDIEAVSRESAQVAALREEEGRLRAEYQARLAQEKGSARPRVIAEDSPPAPARADEGERVREARFQLQRMLERIHSAQLDLDAARSAFKFRYSVIWPPELPRFPVSPRPGRVLLLGLLLSVTLATLVAAAPDLWSGRVMERWQVERSLDVPILGEIRRW